MKTQIDALLEALDLPIKDATRVGIVRRFLDSYVRCDEHGKVKVCPNCAARARGKKGAKALHSAVSHEQRVAWGKKGGRKPKDVVTKSAKDDDVHLKL